MSDTKFNISGNDGEDKDKKDAGGDDFEFKIEKPKKELSSEAPQDEPGAVPGQETPKEEPTEIPEEAPKEEPKETPTEAPSVELREVLQEEPKEMPQETPREVPGEKREPEIAVRGIPKGLKETAKKAPLTYILFGLAAVSLSINLVFLFAMSSAKQKIQNNAILANELALEKEGIAEEKEEITAKVRDLENNILLEKQVARQVVQEKEKLAKELDKLKEEFQEETGGSHQKHTEEMQAVAQKILAINKAYERDKKAYRAMVTENKELKSNVVELSETLKTYTEKRTSQEAVFLYNLGVAYAQGGLYDEALDLFNDSLALEADNPDAHYNLALIYETVKMDNNRAITHLKEYIKSVPDAIDRYQLEVKIESLKRVLLDKKQYPVSK